MKKISILKDRQFKNGFEVKGLGGSDDDSKIEKTIQFDTCINNAKPSWIVAPWSAKYSFADDTVTKIEKSGPGCFKIENPTNCLVIDTNTPSLIFMSTPSENYENPRKNMSDPWQHLLVETSFIDFHNPESFAKVSEIMDVEIIGKVKLLKFEDKMGSVVDPIIHAAQFLLYLTIHNVNVNSKGFGQMIWFGIPFLDNRFEWMDENAAFDIGTQCLMVGIGNRPVYPNGVNLFQDGNPFGGDTSPEYTINISVLDKIKDAYGTARKEGYFQNTELEDLYITGMNMGWELPGTYDVSMKVSEFDILVTQ